MRLHWIPNFITLLRAIVGPVSLFFWAGKNDVAYLWVFGCCALSDLLDGFLARRFHWQSILGSYLDPFCDRVLTLSFFTFLMTRGLCPIWFLGFLVAIALLKLFALLFLKPNTKVPFKPLRLGKWNMAFQFLWVAFLLTYLNLPKWLNSPNWTLPAWPMNIVYGLLAALQLLVFYRYAFRTRIPIPELFPLSSHHGH